MLTNVLLKVTCVRIGAQIFLGPTNVFAQEASKLLLTDECAKVVPFSHSHLLSSFHSDINIFPLLL